MKITQCFCVLAPNFTVFPSDIVCQSNCRQDKPCVTSFGRGGEPLPKIFLHVLFRQPSDTISFFLISRVRERGVYV